MKHEFILTRYTGIGENPLIILIDHSKNVTGKRFDSIDELKANISSGDMIYFVKYRNGDRIDGMHNWLTGKEFDFIYLNHWLEKMDEILSK